MDEAAWVRRLDSLWASFDEQHEDDFLAAMAALVAERPPDDPIGLYEHASAFDSTGHPDRAVGRYRQAPRGAALVLATYNRSLAAYAHELGADEGFQTRRPGLESPS